MDCAWLLTSNAVMSLRFTKFDVRFDDFVTIDACTDASCANSTRLAKLSDTLVTNLSHYSTVRGIYPVMRVVFFTNNLNVATGWDAEWTVAGEVWGCCPKDQYWSSDVCVPCPADRLSPRDNTPIVACVECAAGKFRASQGSLAGPDCVDCAANWYSAAGVGACSQCAASTFSLAGSPECAAVCPATASVTSSGFCNFPSASAASGVVTDWPVQDTGGTECEYLFFSKYAVSLRFSSLTAGAVGDVVTVNRCATAACTEKQQLWRHSGASAPLMVAYTSTPYHYPFLQVVFAANPDAPADGWRAQWGVGRYLPDPPRLTCSGMCQCEETTAMEGIFRDGEGNYADNLNCTYLFASSAPLSVRFMYVHTEDTWDFITVSRCTTASCSNQTVLWYFSGSEPSEELNVVYYRNLPESHPYLLVRFTSDDSRHYGGFVARWQGDPSGGTDVWRGDWGVVKTVVEPARLTCSGACDCSEVTALGGVISDGPGNYANNLNCTYLLTAPGAVSLTFTHFKIHSIEDYVIVNQCTTESCVDKTQLVRIAMSFLNVLTTFRSVPGLRPFLQVVFITSVSDGEEGWSATWTAGPVTYDCLECRKGQYWSFGACADCPADALSPYDNTTIWKCIRCAAGTYVPAEGSSAAGGCVPCAAGMYSTASGLDVNASACALCPPGLYAAGPGYAQCLPGCPPGLFWHAARARCVQCAPASHKNWTGDGSCAPCPPGAGTGGAAGSTGVSACACAPGFEYATPAASACSPCAPGRARNASAARSALCLACPPGSFAARAGARACVPCPRGFVSAGGGGAQCELCPEGHAASAARTLCEPAGAPCEPPRVRVGAAALPAFVRVDAE